VLEEGEVFLSCGPRVPAVGKFALVLLDQRHVAAVATGLVVQPKFNKPQSTVGAVVVNNTVSRGEPPSSTTGGRASDNTANRATE
jgi:hypothetical protein